MPLKISAFDYSLLSARLAPSVNTLFQHFIVHRQTLSENACKDTQNFQHIQIFVLNLSSARRKMCKKVFFTVKSDLFKVHLAIHRATVPAPFGWLRSSERWCQNHL